MNKDIFIMLDLDDEGMVIENIDLPYSPAGEELAKHLYYQHMSLCPIKYGYMWGQCTKDYQAAWMLIASSQDNT